MAQAIHVNSNFFENLKEVDVYSLGPIINPVVLGCGNARERMETIWRQVVDRQQGNLQNGDNNPINIVPINMVYTCIVDRNEATREIDRIRQGKSIFCPRRCQGNNTLVSRVYKWDLLDRLYAQDPDSQVDFTSTGAIRCIANVMNVRLMHAARTGSIERVRELCEDAEIDANYVGKAGWTALIFASHNGHGEVVKLLIEKGAEVNRTGKAGVTALITASHKGRGEVVKLLIEKGAEVDLPDETGRTALMVATIHGHGEVVKLLIEKGAEVNRTGKAGVTALITASRNGRREVVKLLIEKGAEVRPSR